MAEGKEDKFSSAKEQEGPGYKWSQTLNELTLRVPLATGIKGITCSCKIVSLRQLKAKDLFIKLEPASVQVKLKNASEFLLNVRAAAELQLTIGRGNLGRASNLLTLRGRLVRSAIGALVTAHRGRCRRACAEYRSA